MARLISDLVFGIPEAFLMTIHYWLLVVHLSAALCIIAKMTNIYYHQQLFLSVLYTGHKPFALEYFNLHWVHNI